VLAKEILIGLFKKAKNRNRDAVHLCMYNGGLMMKDATRP
jgi:hypothetical protein